MVALLVMTVLQAVGGFDDAAEVFPVEIALGGEGDGAVLVWPLVVGLAFDEAIVRMNEALAWENVTGEPLEETLALYAATGRGYTGSRFTVNTEDRGIIDLTIEIDFVGAYPSTTRHFFTFATETGMRPEARDLFIGDSLEVLAGVLDTLLADRMAEAERAWGEPGMYEGHAFTTDDLESFSIMGDGVEFHYDFGFPHVAEAAEPDGDILMTWDRIAPFIDPDGLLAPWLEAVGSDSP